MFILVVNYICMNKHNTLIAIAVVVIVAAGLWYWRGALPVNTPTPSPSPSSTSAGSVTTTVPGGTTTTSTTPTTTLVYTNTDYGFRVTLPASWQGYSIVSGAWLGEKAGGPVVDRGPTILIRHPAYTTAVPRQDIPIMVFTRLQWDSLQDEAFHIGAAPIGPSELGRNGRYVFALPARYNYAYPVGFEEVDQILSRQPLTTFDI
jgi:hypothetical protein